MELSRIKINDWQAVPDAHSETEFHIARNSLIRTCRIFGSTGALGLCPVSDGIVNEDDWEVDNPDPDFYVIEDMWHPHQSYLIVQCEIQKLSECLLREVWKLDALQQGWIVRLQQIHQENLTELELIITKDGFMSSGWILRRANNIPQLLGALQQYQSSSIQRKLNTLLSKVTK
jgi:hypothetical protein